MFKNRIEAGVQLAERIDHEVFRKGNHNGKNELVIVGIPRGGVPAALECARKLNCQLDIIVCKKIPFPGQCGDPIGAVSSDAVQIMNHDYKEKTNWAGYIADESKKLVEQCQNKELEYYRAAGYEPGFLENKFVVIVDDGIASEAVAMAAIESVRKRGARRIIMAVPVIGPVHYKDFCYNCDDVIALHVCEDISSPAQFYEKYPEVSDKEIIAAMRESTNFAATGAGTAIIQSLEKV